MEEAGLIEPVWTERGITIEFRVFKDIPSISNLLETWEPRNVCQRT